MRCFCVIIARLLALCIPPVLKRNRNSPLARRCDVERHAKHERKSKLSLFPVKIPLYREDRDTTVLSPSVTNSVSSHCITLILLGQTINLLGEWQTQENWGLFAHQPPIGLQYSTICSTNNTIPRTRLTCIRLHLDRPRLHTPCLHASSP